jgi:hypothetical protein
MPPLLTRVSLEKGSPSPPAIPSHNSGAVSRSPFFLVGRAIRLRRSRAAEPTDTPHGLGQLF